MTPSLHHITWLLVGGPPPSFSPSILCILLVLYVALNKTALALLWSAYVYIILQPTSFQRGNTSLPVPTTVSFNL